MACGHEEQHMFFESLRMSVTRATLHGSSAHFATAAM